MPAVSVLMTTLNSARFLAESIESILAQTLSSWELIVVDGGSDDATQSIVRQYADPRIRLLVRQGLRRSAQLNAAVLASASEFIAIQDSDDVALPERLALEVDFLREHTEVTLVAAWGRLMSERGKLDGVLRRPSDHDAILKSLLNHSEPLFCSAIWRKEVSEGRPFNEALKKNVDLEWYIRVSPTAVFASIPTVLEHIRETPGSLSKTRDGENDKALVASIDAFCNERRSQGCTARESFRLTLWQGIARYYYGARSESLQYLWEALKGIGPDPMILRYLVPQLIMSESGLRQLKQNPAARRIADFFRGSRTRR